MIRLILLVLMFAAFAAFAQGGASTGDQPPEFKPRDWGTAGWTQADTARQAGVFLGLMADAAYSRDIGNHYPKVKEVGFTSIFCGDNPSAACLYRFLAAFFLGHTFVAYNADPPVRAGWQYGAMIGSAITVRNHQNNGLQPDWPLVGLVRVF